MHDSTRLFVGKNCLNSRIIEGMLRQLNVAFERIVIADDSGISFSIYGETPILQESGRTIEDPRLIFRYLLRRTPQTSAPPTPEEITRLLDGFDDLYERVLRPINRARDLAQRQGLLSRASRRLRPDPAATNPASAPLAVALDACRDFSGAAAFTHPLLAPALHESLALLAEMRD